MSAKSTRNRRRRERERQQRREDERTLAALADLGRPLPRWRIVTPPSQKMDLWSMTADPADLARTPSEGVRG